MMLQKCYFFRKMKLSIQPTKGYVDTDALIAYHNEAEGLWIASDLRTGLLLDRGKTRKEVIETVADKKLAALCAIHAWRYKEIICDIWGKYSNDYILNDDNIIKAWHNFNFGLDK